MAEPIRGILDTSVVIDLGEIDPNLLQWAAATWDALPFDVDAARMYGRRLAAMRASGRTSRARLADLLIASTTAANGLALYTPKPGDIAGLERLVAVKAV